MNQIPLVSVVIPSYNRAQLSLRAIQSVLKQTYNNIELIFVNDGSTEDYSEVEILSLEAGARYFKINNQGVSAARNLGIEKSTGELIAFLDSDDEWLEEKISKQVEVLRDNPELMLVQALERWIRNGKVLNIPERLKPANGKSFQKALEYCCIAASSVVIRKEVFKEVGTFDQNLRICEDYDLWLRILDLYPVWCIQEELHIRYGGHADQLSMSEQAIDRFRVFALLKYLVTAKDLFKKDLVIKKLNQKLEILIKGSEKRGFEEKVTLYVRIKELLLLIVKGEESADALLEDSLCYGIL